MRLNPVRRSNRHEKVMFLVKNPDLIKVTNLELKKALVKEKLMSDSTYITDIKPDVLRKEAISGLNL